MNIFLQPAALFLAQAARFLPGPSCRALLLLPHGRDPRFVTIILRGALDGLTAVPPVGDPDYEALRQQIAMRTEGDNPALALDGFFALHPSLRNFQRLYRKGEAAVVHASATGYRDRSHFDGQDVLESGFPTPAMSRRVG